MNSKTINIKAKLEVNVCITLNEDELRALDGIFGYNVDVFLKAFYEKMGRNYVQPYEAGVRSLHKTVRSACAGPLAEIEKVRKAHNIMSRTVISCAGELEVKPA